MGGNYRPFSPKTAMISQSESQVFCYLLVIFHGQQVDLVMHWTGDSKGI